MRRILRSIILKTLLLFLLTCASAQAQTLGTCASSVGTDSQHVTISVTQGQGIVVAYKSISSDSGLLDSINGANRDSLGNTYSSINGVGSASGNCEEARFAIAGSTGSDRLTAPGPNPGALNFIIACPVTNFGAIDVAGGMAYTAGNTAKSGSITPTASSELVLGTFYVESGNANTPTWSGGWTDYVDSGSPSDVPAGTSSSGFLLSGLAQETSTLNTATGIQQLFTTSANTPPLGTIGFGMW